MLEPYLGWLGKLGIFLGLVTSYVSGVSYTRSFLRIYDAQGIRAAPVP